MIKKKILIAVVPAREKSKEIKNKNLIFYKKKKNYQLGFIFGPVSKINLQGYFNNGQ